MKNNISVFQGHAHLTERKKPTQWAIDMLYFSRVKVYLLSNSPAEELREKIVALLRAIDVPDEGECSEFLWDYLKLRLAAKLE